MGAYKPGQLVTVGFDPDSPISPNSALWRVSDQDSEEAIDALRLTRGIAMYGAELGPYWADAEVDNTYGAFSDIDGNAMLDILDVTFEANTAANKVGETPAMSFNSRVPFTVRRGDITRHAALRQSYFDLLTQWQGYPVEVTWAEFSRSTVNATQFVSFADLAKATPLRKLSAWIDPPIFPDEEDQFVRLTKADGSKIDSADAFPLLQNTGAAFIGSIKIIQSPGRMDTDGTTQPKTNPPGVTEGEFPLTTLQRTDRPDYSKASFRARIMSSEVLPEFRPPITPEGLELDRATRVSAHQIMLQVSDRGAAGLRDTPLTLGAAIYPQYKIGNRRFYLRRVLEEDGEGLQLTLNTSRFD